MKIFDIPRCVFYSPILSQSWWVQQ